MTLPRLLFSPLLPWWGLALAAGLGLALIGWGARGGGRTLWRVIPFAVLLAALANPRLAREDATVQDDVAVVVVDDSASMMVGDRSQQSRQALDDVLARLARLGHLTVRVEHYRPPAGRDEGTRLMGFIDRILADIPRRRLAGVIAISDGQIEDVPERSDFGAPLHLLLAGHRNDRDRRLEIVQAPGFGLVGGSASVTLIVDDPGQTGSADLAIRRDGGPASHVSIPLNRQTGVDVPIDHPGANVVELEVAAVPGELTLANNRAVVSVSGIRDRLRVLLVSGEPHPGERSWRNLLKADPSVDLVHFTILRPPEKDDRTPLRDLALIAFPVRELFEEKLHDFDLIIFDRYRRRSVLPPVYYQNIANYVRGGGALLVAAGPEFALPDTPYSTALADVLPVAPTGRVEEEAFLPQVTEIGRRHPVTAGLAGADADPPRWGKWVRVIAGTGKGHGQTLMQAPNGMPLVVLDRVGDGRVAQVMSDGLWLWGRGWDGGGPQTELIRRLAHWLMKEPELEEERLSAEISGDRLRVERHSLEPGDVTVTVTAPDGTDRPLALAPARDGMAAAEMVIDQAGLWRVGDGARTALAGAGALNPVEMANVRATPDRVAAVLAATGGGWRWIEDGLPDLRQVAPGGRTSGSGWFGLLANADRVVTAIRDTPLLPGPALLLLTLGGLMLAWWREGK
jgi:hypothetical protein